MATMSIPNSAWSDFTYFCCFRLVSLLFFLCRLYCHIGKLLFTTIRIIKIPEPHIAWSVYLLFYCALLFGSLQVWINQIEYTYRYDLIWLYAHGRKSHSLTRTIQLHEKQYIDAVQWKFGKPNWWCRCSTCFSVSMCAWMMFVRVSDAEMPTFCWNRMSCEWDMFNDHIFRIICLIYNLNEISSLLYINVSARFFLLL